MAILTNLEIDNECLLLIDKLNNYHQPLRDAFQIMYLHGLRTIEICNKSLWSVNPDTSLTLSTAKFGDERIFLESDLPSFYYSFITSADSSRYYYSVESMQRVFNKFTSYPTLYIKSKQVGCHLFRHNFCKKLYDNGYSVEAISERLGHQELTSTMGYILSQVKTSLMG